MSEEDYMRQALRQAERARRRDEVPVGAVIVKDGRVIARGRNRRERRKDATQHAELVCIRRACRRLRSWRLCGCTMYVTLEPCPMCAGAAVNARLDGVVYGAKDRNAGACGTLFTVCGQPVANHTTKVWGGVLEDECARILSSYFAAKRKKPVNGVLTPKKVDNNEKKN